MWWCFVITMLLSSHCCAVVDTVSMYLRMICTQILFSVQRGLMHFSASLTLESQQPNACTLYTYTPGISHFPVPNMSIRICPLYKSGCSRNLPFQFLPFTHTLCIHKVNTSVMRMCNPLCFNKRVCDRRIPRVNVNLEL